MALARAARQLTVDFFATSALVTWVAIVLLSYQAPWLALPGEGPEPG